MSQADDTTTEGTPAALEGAAQAEQGEATQAPISEPSSEPAGPATSANEPTTAGDASKPGSALQEAATGAPAVPATPRTGPLRRFVQWFTRADELEATRATLSQEGETQLFKRRAAAALEVAERILRPIEPMQGNAELVAVEALTQAIFWALAARTGRVPGSRSEAWTALREHELSGLKNPELIARAFSGDDAARGSLKEAEVTACVAGLHGLAADAVSAVHEPDARLKSLRAQRGLRCGVIAVLITVAGGYGVFLVSRGANLANIATWRTSSTLNNCTPETHKCQGKAFTPFFHTNSEKSPWLEYDFGARRRVSKVVVENRRDCCKDRAVPLLVEVSDDRKHWKKVAERKKSFNTATLTFKPTSARYLRLRVNKTTPFHLESVAIYR